jgi:hypothetical protein
MGSIQRTIYELLGLGSLNLEDALASDLSDMFTTEPNLTPYNALPTDSRVFEPGAGAHCQAKNRERESRLSGYRRQPEDPQELSKKAGDPLRPLTDHAQTAIAAVAQWLP